jgi:hypothetical protein
VFSSLDVIVWDEKIDFQFNFQSIFHYKTPLWPTQALLRAPQKDQDALERKFCLSTNVVAKDSTFLSLSHSFSNHKLTRNNQKDIADTFEGSFKEQSSINSNWMPVNNAKVRIRLQISPRYLLSGLSINSDLNSTWPLGSI